MAQLSVARQKLDELGFEWLIEQFEHGRSVRDIASEVGVSHMTVHRYAHQDEIHSARTEQALIAGAESYEAEAVRILAETYDRLDGEAHPNAGALASLARERAQAAWRQASVRDPRRYSDRRTTADITVTHRTEAAQLSTAELERIARQGQTLEMDNDTGEVSDH